MTLKILFVEMVFVSTAVFSHLFLFLMFCSFLLILVSLVVPVIQF